jgi:hypothetical protein
MTTSAELIPTGKIVLDSTSRFRDSKIYTDPITGIDFYETYQVHNFPPSPNDLYHEVAPGEEGRLDLITFRYYGNPALWWAIADANSLSFPPTDIVVGLVLRIPALQTIQGP